MMKPEDYLQLRYTRQIVQEDDGSWRAEITEFPGCFAAGDTDVEALTALADVAYAWVESMLATDQAIPSPAEENDYSGRLVLRMGKTLHQKAARCADVDGVSLNMFITNCLAECVGAKPPVKVLPAVDHHSNFYRMMNFEHVPGPSVNVFTGPVIFETSNGRNLFENPAGVRFDVDLVHVIAASNNKARLNA